MAEIDLPGVQIMMNPGTGQVQFPCDEETARANAERFIEAVRQRGGTVGVWKLGPQISLPRRWSGRWWLELQRKKRGRIVEVEIPGCAFEHIDPWKDLRTPRLYVHGNSCYWPSAVKVAAAALGGPPFEAP